jgi:ankyrin repeat protein
LHEAASQGLTNIILRRLGEGAPMDETDDNGRTALGMAISEENIGAVTVLLSQGADVEAPCGPFSLRPVPYILWSCPSIQQ